MLMRKCNICGKEMRMTTPRYKVTFEGWLYTQEKDICIDCFNRIAEEIKQADTPQTEICDTCKYRSSNVFGNWCVGRDTCDRYEADTPQTEREAE